MKKWLLLGGAIVTAGVAIVFATSTSTSIGPEPEPQEPMARRTDPKPTTIYVGTRGDPELEGLLNEFDAVLASAGVRNFRSAEVTKLRKTPGPSYAIPHRDAWPKMVRTLQLLQRVRDQLGAPITIYNGFRPEDYNKAVGGARDSDHIWAEAVDAYVERPHQDAFMMALARLYDVEGARLKMSFGVYGDPRTGEQLEAHVGTGSRQRTWGAAKTYLDRVRAVS